MKTLYSRTNRRASYGMPPIRDGQTPHGDVPVPREASFRADANRHPARQRLGNAWPLIARLAVWLVLPCGCALAQNFAIRWSTIDAGGGTSSGGAYSVSGTIGQPDAGTMSGGNFSLQGGFWPGIVVLSSSEVPTLFIHLSGDSVVISWSPATPGFELEATMDLAGAVWTSAPAGNPVTIPVSGPAKFYRLKKR